MSLGKQRGGYSPDVINPVNPEADDSDLPVVVGVQELTIEALKKSGFSDKDAYSTLAMVASAYAANILLAQLRDAELLPRRKSAEDDIEAAYVSVRERLGVTHPEPTSAFEGDDFPSIRGPMTSNKKAPSSPYGPSS